MGESGSVLDEGMEEVEKGHMRKEEGEMFQLGRRVERKSSRRARELRGL